MKHEIKYIQPMTLVFSAWTFVLLAQGIIGGILRFFVTPDPLLGPMSATAKLTAMSVFALGYTLISIAVIVLSAFVYNLFCSGLGVRGIRIQFEAVEGEDAEAAQQ